MRVCIGSVILSAASFIAGGLALTSEFQTCFSIDGTVHLSSFRCDNSTTGHSACCAAGDVCWSNGICHGRTNGIEVWRRMGCTDYSWNNTACFQACPWYVGYFGAGIRPCGGIDKSNLYCCDDGKTGVGSFACCKNESLIFAYGNITTLPTILATIPLADVSTRSDRPTSISITGTITPSPTPAPTVLFWSGSESESSTPANTNTAAAESSPAISSTAIGLGLGLGLPIAAVIIGGIWYMIWRRSGRTQSEKEAGVVRGTHELPSD